MFPLRGKERQVARRSAFGLWRLAMPALSAATGVARDPGVP